MGIPFTAQAIIDFMKLTSTCDMLDTHQFLQLRCLTSQLIKWPSQWGICGATFKIDFVSSFLEIKL